MIHVDNRQRQHMRQIANIHAVDVNERKSLKLRLSYE